MYHINYQEIREILKECKSIRYTGHKITVSTVYLLPTCQLMVKSSNTKFNWNNFIDSDLWAKVSETNKGGRFGLKVLSFASQKSE